MMKFAAFLATLSITALGISTIAWADPATQPAPTQQAAPTSQPAAHFPTPAELLAKMKAAREKEDAEAKVALFDLSDGIAE